jgi:hypothetical protein
MGIRPSFAKSVDEFDWDFLAIGIRMRKDSEPVRKLLESPESFMIR